MGLNIGVEVSGLAGENVAFGDELLVIGLVRVHEDVGVSLEGDSGLGMCEDGKHKNTNIFHIL